MSSKPSYSFFQKVFAFSVHIFTSLGIVCGFLAILAISDQEWRIAMFWLLAGLLIDGVDGTFARLFKVKEVLPNFDGKSIDYVIDFANYALIPAYFMYEAAMLPPSVNLFSAIAVLLVSAIYYGKTGMVTEDYHFEGFPVLWNMAACFLFFVWQLDPWWNFTIIMILCILHFVPIKYVYPSMTSRLKRWNIVVTVVFFIALTLILFIYPESSLPLQICATLTVVYYGLVGLYSTFKK